MKTRAILTIVISIILGFVVGFYTSSQIARHRTRDVKSLSSKEKFRMRTFSIIEPTEDQKEKILPIVDEYAAHFDSLKKHTYKEFNIFFEKYHSNLEPYLNEEQIEHLRNFPKHHKKKHDKPKSPEEDDSKLQ